MMMVMMHNGWEKRCPYCFSRKLHVVDYGVTDEKFKHLGVFWHLLQCEKCKGKCQDINNLESKSERLAKYEAKKRLREEQQ